VTLEKVTEILNSHH